MLTCSQQLSEKSSPLSNPPSLQFLRLDRLSASRAGCRGGDIVVGAPCSSEVADLANRFVNSLYEGLATFQPSGHGPSTTLTMSHWSRLAVGAMHVFA
jgi:hypothetical protein